MNQGFKGLEGLFWGAALEIKFRILNKIFRVNFKINFEPKATTI